MTGPAGRVGGWRLVEDDGRSAEWRRHAGGGAVAVCRVEGAPAADAHVVWAETDVGGHSVTVAPADRGLGRAEAVRLAEHWMDRSHAWPEGAEEDAGLIP